MPVDPSILFKQVTPGVDVGAALDRGMQMGQRMNEASAQKDAQKREKAKQIIWSINDQKSYEAAKEQMAQLGAPGLEQWSPYYDENQVKLMKYASLAPEQQVQLANRADDRAYDEKWKKMEFDEGARRADRGYNLQAAQFGHQKDMDFGKLGIDRKKYEQLERQIAFDERMRNEELKLNQGKLDEQKEARRQANKLAYDEMNAKFAGGSGVNEGQKAVDKDYAKDYNDYTGGGRAKAADAIAKLESYMTEMQNDNGMFQAGGGPIAGSLPDAFRTQTSISRRDNIVSVANSALKATFGAQLSDGERKALANEFYNDKLSNAENLKIISRKIQELKNGMSAQDAKADYFQRNRNSLAGFRMDTAPTMEGTQRPQYTAEQVSAAQQELQRRRARAGR